MGHFNITLEGGKGLLCENFFCELCSLEVGGGVINSYNSISFVFDDRDVESIHRIGEWGNEREVAKYIN